MIKKSAWIGVITLFLLGVISCEKEFTDITTNIITNDEFSTKDTIIDIIVTNRPVTSVRADGLALGGSLGQYLLGVLDKPSYEKLEASIVSQVAINPFTTLVSQEYGIDTTVVTTVDEAFLKLPYQATLDSITGGVNYYSLDSIFGNRNNTFNLNVYRSNTYLSNLDPLNPASGNSFQSNDSYEKLDLLNETPNFNFLPNPNDTIAFVDRFLSNGVKYDTDTIKYTTSANTIPIPFINVPLDKNKIKQYFLDVIGTTDFSSQDLFNNFFRGLIIEATGSDSYLLSMALSSNTPDLRPAIEVFYTNSVISNGAIIDTLKVKKSFDLSGIRNNIYKMIDKTYPNNGDIIVQGTAGSQGEINLLSSIQIQDLKSKNWLINDASLLFYINKSSDTTLLPESLMLYKEGISPSGGTYESQIIDILTDGTDLFNGNLQKTSSKPDLYKFRITEYISRILKGDETGSDKLILKARNVTDIPSAPLDTLVDSYNWNPKAVTLLNGDKNINGDRRAQLKISYTEKKN